MPRRRLDREAHGFESADELTNVLPHLGLEYEPVIRMPTWLGAENQMWDGVAKSPHLFRGHVGIAIQIVESVRLVQSKCARLRVQRRAKSKTRRRPPLPSAAVRLLHPGRTASAFSHTRARVTKL